MPKSYSTLQNLHGFGLGGGANPCMHPRRHPCLFPEAALAAYLFTAIPQSANTSQSLGFSSFGACCSSSCRWVSCCNGYMSGAHVLQGIVFHARHNVLLRLPRLVHSSAPLGTGLCDFHWPWPSLMQPRIGTSQCQTWSGSLIRGARNCVDQNSVR